MKEANGCKTILVAAFVEHDVAARLEKFNAPYTRVVNNTFVRDLLSWVMPALLFVGLWVLHDPLLRKKQGGMAGLK